MWSDINLWFVAAYITVFVLAAYKAGEFQWLWASVAVWVGLSLLGAKVLPGVWGMTHLSAIYAPHFYITVASVFFWLNRWKKHPQSGWRQAEGSTAFLSLFAVSGWLLTAACAMLAALSWYRFPDGLTPYVLPALLHLYWLEPVYWGCMQALLMLLFYLHRSMIAGQPANWFSRRQLQIGLLLALCLQAAFVLATLLRIRY